VLAPLWEETVSMLKELPERHPAGVRPQSGLIHLRARTEARNGKLWS
jgi:hypothetical protein